jgi:ABC-2 type transport system permease protein
MNPTLLGFIRKEIRQTLRDYRMRVVLFLAPVFQLTLFGVAQSNEVRNVRLAAVYKPSDQKMQEIYQSSVSSGWFVPTEVKGNDIFEWIRSNQADAVLVAPEMGLSKGLNKGEAQLQLLINAQNVIRAQAIERYMTTIVDKVMSKNQKSPLEFKIRALYNPSFETSIYMVPGVMSMLVCMVAILMTSMGVARERESGTLETLLVAPIERWEIVLGKTIPYLLLGLCQIPIILLVAIVVFSVPMRGSLFLIFFTSLLFLMNTVSIGLMISTIAINQQQAMLGGFLFLFPAILLSGLMFPIESMPWIMRMIAELNPLTHFIGLLRNIMLKGGDFNYILIHCSALVILSIVCVWIALRRFNKILI